MTSRARSRIAIFDLDRTLIRCDSFPTLLNSLLFRNWWRVTGAVLATPLLLLLSVASQARQLASDTMNVVSRDLGEVDAENASHNSRLIRRYLPAVEDAFGGDVDFATLQKLYGTDAEDEERYPRPAAEL